MLQVHTTARQCSPRAVPVCSVVTVTRCRVVEWEDCRDFLLPACVKAPVWYITLHMGHYLNITHCYYRSGYPTRSTITCFGAQWTILRCHNVILCFVYSMFLLFLAASAAH